MQRTPRSAFTLIEILVAIGIIGVLLGILLPAAEIARHKGYITACASNLRQIGQALAIYSNENRGAYPRTIYVPGQPPTVGTGTTSPDPFLPAGPQPNDVTAAVWLLLRTEHLNPSTLICPYNDVNEFEPDHAQPANQSNFTNYKKNLGYSYANPYPAQAAVDAGYRLTNRVDATFALMADINPGVNPARNANVFAPAPGAPSATMRRGNSDNHEREGQNVLYGDGHVAYQTTPLCGTSGDNIYTAQGAASPTIFATPATKNDSILLPTD